jgi:serine/threonine protein kinase
VEYWTHHREAHRDQGWKVHVSCREGLLQELLLRVQPALGRIAYKVIRSEEQLGRLNAGTLGATQVGKCITAYPNSDGETAEVAVELAKGLHGWQAPLIRNEIRVLPRSPVYIRYGSFSRTQGRDKLGIPRAYVRDVRGYLVEDDRNCCSHIYLGYPALLDGTIFSVPSELFGRYILLKQVIDKGPTLLFQGIDRHTGECCAVRLAVRNAALDSMGRDAVQRAENEAALLSALGTRSNRKTPRLIGFYDGEDYCVLVREWIVGETVSGLIWSGALTAVEKRRITQSVAAIIGELHSLDIYSLDIAPTNLVRDRSGNIMLIELESATSKAKLPNEGFGTPGYSVPSSRCGGELDAYSLKCLMFSLETGIDLSKCADPERLVRERLFCNKSSSSAIEVLREQDLFRRARPLVRYSSHSLVKRKSARIVGVVKWPIDQTLRSLCARIISDAAWTSDTPEWSSTALGLAGLSSLDFYSGSAGICYGLLRGGLALEDEDIVQTVKLMGASIIGRADTESLCGLFVGRGGAAWLSLALWYATKEPAWLESAKRLYAGLDETLSPDLTHGIAGQLLLGVWLLEASPDSRIQRSVQAKVAQLRDTVVWQQGMPLWVVPEGYGELSGSGWLGLAHGAAGISWALLEAGRALQSDETTFYIRALLAQLSDRFGNAEKFEHLPDRLDGTARGSAWCHGHSGIAWVSHRASQFGVPGPSAKRLLRLAMKEAHRLDFSQCHGLSSLIELGSALGDPYMRRFSEILCVRYLRVSGGYLEVSSTANSSSSHDFMVGTAGAVSALSCTLGRGRLGYFLDNPKQALRA